MALLSGCSNDSKQIKLILPEYATELASSHVVKAAIEQYTDYSVELVTVSVPTMWQGLASGDADATVGAWLPTTHGQYLKQTADKIVDLGKNLMGTRIGLVVPQYVQIDSIAELNANADKFNNKIVGIAPGAGLMVKTEKVIKAYGIDKLKLMEGTGPMMAAALGDAITKKQWIVVTGWTPHWKFARWKLKYLKDPQNVYGGAEYISTFVRKGFKKEHPEIYKVLDNFTWTPKDMEQVMAWNQVKGADYNKNAKRWIRENKEKVKKWFAGVKTAR